MPKFIELQQKAYDAAVAAIKMFFEEQELDDEEMVQALSFMSVILRGR